MENASKALIIAGAILLSILLISLGIMIFTQAQGAIDGSGMSDMEVRSFNQKFLKYEGKQKGTAIRSLVQEVMANNNSEEVSDETMVTINVNYVLNGATAVTEAGAEAIVKLEQGGNKQPTFGSLQNTKTYTVSFGYYNGRITSINIA